MTYLVQVREASEWGFYWDVKRADHDTRREAVRWARSYVPMAELDRLKLEQSWRDRMAGEPSGSIPRGDQ